MSKVDHTKEELKAIQSQVVSEAFFFAVLVTGIAGSVFYAIMLFTNWFWDPIREHMYWCGVIFVTQFIAWYKHFTINQAPSTYHPLDGSNG